MPRKRNNPVSLSREDRASLEGLIACGHAPARQLTHARILLKADEGEDAPYQASSWPDTKIADALQISRSTVARVRERFAWEGLEAALVHRRPKATKPKKLDGALYEAFAPTEARRLLERLEIHYTPKHGSWLNMAEIELSVLARQCLDRRIADRQTLAEEVGAWEAERNAYDSSIDWRFTTQEARIKLKHLYPEIVEPSYDPNLS
jgi:hypothetical protein